ncbi:hypothetical protein [Prauserella muralis]|uniref:Uncharacterized protein n=1 Tax=Prauserella muralis TaxID=588067 RepID=A0A2V4BK89_9PSEU|nr:hypothetical protein [Prauserella muralis]PXY31103.1 hypothetical protein BAY60_01420 [Prauserella muralis]TWE14609.1 hypothetical protein FHX69_6766 [Prauserella muralis]
MVGKLRAVLGATALRLARAATEDSVTYCPHALNRLISTVTAREVAGRLRERAAWHAWCAEDAGVTAFERQWHASEAVELEELAGRELAAAGLAGSEATR